MRAAVAFGLAGLAAVCGAVFLIWFGVSTTADEYDVALYIPFLVAASVFWVLWRRLRAGAGKWPAWVLVVTLFILTLYSGYLFFLLVPIPLLLGIATAVAPPRRLTPAAAAPRRRHG